MKKLKISLIVLSLIAYACGGADEAQEIPADTTTPVRTKLINCPNKTLLPVLTEPKKTFASAISD